MRHHIGLEQKVKAPTIPDNETDGAMDIVLGAEAIDLVWKDWQGKPPMSVVTDNGYYKSMRWLRIKGAYRITSGKLGG